MCSSDLKTAMSLLGVSGDLGARVQGASSFEQICSLPAMRTDADAIAAALPMAAPAAAVPASAGAAAQSAEAPDQSTNAFSRIAMSLDLAMQAATPLPPVAVTHPSFSLDATHAAIAPHALLAPRTKGQTLDYIQAVAARVERLRPASAAKPRITS